ncbi:MAG: ATP-binding cassette domain-containing protein [Devosia nanyangense]|uniref:ATP-binding cassette domain-containing protein n=1 Tax=Devosia nanyangense TaxID=1228055 RepID=A0A933L5M3_9HYPH|nr:ATP-binding cassette domain-containing protein [Devosia nanyangense]
MADGPQLNIDIVAKRFAVLPVPLMVDLHLEVAAASVVALVGPSGVGKSTLLRMIAGIDTDFAGTIVIDGVPAATAPPAGFVFQDARLLPWLTAEANIRAVREATTPAEARDLLGRVGLAGYENAYPHELSGGMQRRVALARAFSVNPRLLLLDEPFVSLDRHLVTEVQQVFLDLVRDTSATVVLVTHLPEDAARLADRAILLTGQPARIIADIVLPGLRGTRGAAEISRLIDEIALPSSETAL